MAICIIDDQGTVCLERTVRSEVGDIVGCLKGFDQPIETVGFEAGNPLSRYWRLSSVKGPALFVWGGLDRKIEDQSMVYSIFAASIFIG